jgi:hypothetical protein
MKTLKHVGTEMALHALAYNMKRVMSKFRRELRKQRLRTVDQRKGRKTDHEKGETNSRHRERRVSAPSPHLIRRALSPRLANGLAGKNSAHANSPASRPGDLNVQVEVVVAQAAANVDHLGMRTSRFVDAKAPTSSRRSAVITDPFWHRHRDR